jgi:VWFA-related protein
MGTEIRVERWKRLGIAIACMAGAAAVALVARTQEPAKPASTEAQRPVATAPVITTESRLVLVDTVVRDKKGQYVTDLTQKDFKVFEDNKEQPISSFSSGSDPAIQNANQKHYMILFFDTSSMEMADQMQARQAAVKFIDSNSGADRLIAVVNFGGTLVIQQNFTSNPELLKAAVNPSKTPNINTNGQGSQPVVVAMSGAPSISHAEEDFGARTMLLSVRSLAKNLRGVPGRKMLILFTAGFPLTADNMSELTATIDACNKANVAIYPLDVRGLTTSMPTPGPGGGPGSARIEPEPNETRMRLVAMRDGAMDIRPRLVLASYRPDAMLEPQHGGGGGGGTGGGGTGGGGTGGGGGHGGTGGTGGTGGGTGGGGKGSGGTGTGGSSGGGHAGGGGTAPIGTPYGNYYNPATSPKVLLPQIPPSASQNQQVMQMLADGTGGFTIYNTNDLLGGLQRIAQEMNHFYVLGYVPAVTEEGSCHALKVKANRNGLDVRSRTGYCNVRPTNPLDGKPIEKQMEAQASGSAQGTIHASMETPYFYAAPNIARVNLSLELPGDSIVFNKDKGKYHANVNVLGIAYKPDGSVGARFSDTLNLDMEKDEWKEFSKQPYHYQNQFDAAPGIYKLSVVFSTGGEGFAKVEHPLQIDAYDGEKFTLGGVVLSASMQRVDEIPTEVDATLLEDRKPLIVKGMQINPAASYQFKKTDNVVLYSELYEPLLKTDPAMKVVAGYRVFDASNKQVFFTGGVPLDGFVEKGNAVVPFALKVDTKDLPPGNYKLVLLAVDGKNNQAPQRPVEFTLGN